MFQIMYKLVCFGHTIKTVINYSFKFFQKIKTIIDDYGFKFKVKTMIDDFKHKTVMNNYDFNFSKKFKTIIINYDFDNMQ